ncbi:MAG: glycosyltransferase, partial [Nitrospinota bacterium]
MDTHRSPLISVVIPAYNAGKFVAQAVQSVLDQTYPHHEIIVVDDGSTDETRAELRKFGDRLRYFSQQNRGPSAARNAGIRAAQGEYICFLDADDIWLPQKLEMQLDFMTGHQEIGLVFAAIEEFQTDGEFTRRWFPGEERFGADFTSQQPIQEAFRKLLMVNFIPTNTVMVRRECLEKAGLFDESLRLVEDRDLWLRIAASFPIACLPSVLCRRRRHGANLSQDFALALRSRLQMLEKN